MSIRAISFKSNDDQQIQKKNYMPAAAATAVVTTGAGAAGGYFLTKLDEDSFIKASIADKEATATKEIADGEKKISELLGSEASDAIKANDNNLALRQKLDAADAEFAKVAEWKDGKAVKLEKAEQAAFDKAVKEQKEAYDALLKAVGNDEKKMLSESEFKANGVKIKNEALAKLSEENKAAVTAAEESISKAKASLAEVEAHKAFKPEGENKLSELAKKFKNIFTPAEGGSRGEEVEKKVSEFTKQLKKSNSFKYAAAGAIVGVIALVGAYFANKSNKA